MKASPLTEETAQAILDAAWQLICKRGRVDVGIADIARAAGVTRQSVYLGYGNRVGLLTAMARNADAKSGHSQRMRDISQGDGADAQALLDFVEAWLAHLPEIYPVGVLLSAAAVVDAEARAVFNDRMVGSLHAAFLRICKRLEGARALARDVSATDAADICWSLTHIEAWRQLVIERGWKPAEFVVNRKSLIRAAVLRV